VKSFGRCAWLDGFDRDEARRHRKGRILAAIARQRPIPVYFIGVGGEGRDLQPFSADEFADALLGN